MARPPNPLFYLLATYVGFKISLAFLESEVDYKSHAVGVVLLFPLFSIIRPTWSIFYFVHGLLLRGLIVLIQRGHVPPGLLVYIVAPIALSLFLATRHLQLQKRRFEHPLDLKKLGSDDPHPLSLLSGPYFLFVLGSGGHTKEMLAMMETGFKGFKNLHRRYVISSGDDMSIKHLEAFEKQVAEKWEGEASGSFDKFVVTRSRRVHQSLVTTPFTSVKSILQIFPILLSRPKVANKDVPQFPQVIVINGPATGFFVGLVAHLLKMVYLAPEESMQVMYVESWARIKTLSLTGKLFYYSDVADLFLVQHQALSERYGIPNAGYLVLGRGEADKGSGLDVKEH